MTPNNLVVTLIIIMYKKSFSLIEVLIFTAILALFFVAAISITVVSLRNMKYNEHKILATHYAEELLNWLREEKEADWSNFSDKAIGSYCFNSDIVNWPSLGDCGTNDYSLGSFYKRSVHLSKEGNPVSRFTVAITVSWRELGNTYSVPLNTVFTIWE